MILEHNKLGGYSTAVVFEGNINALQGTIGATRDMLMATPIDTILDSLIAETAIGVSDGSFKPKFGIVCWIFEIDIGTEIIVGLILMYLDMMMNMTLI